MSAPGEGPRAAGIDGSAHDASHRPAQPMHARENTEVAP